MAGKQSIEDVNALDFEAFIKHFQNVVEHGMLIAGAVWSYHPFSSFDHLHRSFCDVMDSLPKSGRQSILRCHPNLAGKLARQGAITPESQREQASAGLGSLTDTQLSDIGEHNEIYRAKFGFPFVVCARENKVAAILEGLHARCRNPEDEELRTGVEEVKKISYYRLLDLVHPGGPEVGGTQPKL